MRQDSALEHLRVIDLTHYIAGPYCTKLLADSGADVIKIERPGEGDGARGLGPFLGDIPGKERSGLFWYLNTNKRSITLDLKTEDDRRTLRRLVSHSDVVVENFSPGKLESQGLGYEVLSLDNQALVMTSISNFGQTGPYRDYKATDIVAYALTGLMSISGQHDREPLKHGLHQAAFRAGQYAAAATLAGVFGAQSTGKGTHIDASVMESLVTGFVHQLTPYVYEGQILRRDPKVGLSFGGHGQPIETSDGYVIPGTGPASTWEDLGKMLDEPALLDPRFSTPAGREAYAQEIDAILARNFKMWRKYDLVRRAQEKRFGFSVVQSIKDILECPHLGERGYFVQADLAEKKGVKMPGAPFHMTITPSAIRWGAPRLGEHTEEIRRWLQGTTSEAAPRSLGVGQSHAIRPPLSGIRVLEPAAAVAGPHAGKLLAWLGAEVIKIESLVRPCNLRGVGRGPLLGSEPGRQYWNESGAHNEINLGKLNMTLDFRTQEGRDAFKELVSISDVVLENFTPRVMKGFGLGYDDLVNVKPDLIMVSVTGYGHTGPYRDYASFGMGIEAVTGCAWVTGYLGGPPRRCGMAYSDDLTAIHALFATLAAIQYRNRTGKGQWIDVSMYEAGHFVVEAIMDYVLNGRDSERLGNRDRNCVPQGCYPCQGDNQWLTLSVCNQEQWVSLCNIIGKSEWVKDPSFQTKEQRWETHDEIDRYIQAWAGVRGKIQAMHELQSAGIPAGAVLNNKEILLNRHLRARDYFTKVTHKSPHLGEKIYPGLPFTFDQARLPYPRPAGELGEHNWPVLTELLDKSPGEVRRWEQRDIIGTVPLGARGATPREATPETILMERGALQGYDANHDAILERGELIG